VRRFGALAGLVTLAVVGLASATPAVAHHRDADQTARIAALEARVTALEARVTALEAPDATPVPSASPGSSTAPTASPMPLAAGVVSSPGVYSLGGRTVRDVTVRADDVTITGPGRIDFLRIEGVARTVVRDVDLGAGNETPIVLRPSADGTPVRDLVIEDVRILQSGEPANGIGYSAVSTGPDGPQPHERVTLRRLTIDTRGVGWGGIEVWNTRGLVIEDSTFTGGCRTEAGICSFVSPPRSDGVIVRRNTFDFRAGGWWGVELADVDDAQVIDNIVLGPDLARQRPFAVVEINPGSGTSDRAFVARNRVTGVWNFVNANGQGHVITDNCLTDVGSFSQYGPWTGPVTIERNGPCP